jgi:undecaprenyl-diphosphatase
LQTLDRWLFYQINGLAGQSRALDALARLVVNDYLAPSAIVMLLVWMWLRGRSGEQRRADTGVAISAVVAQFLANMVLKVVNLAYFRPRPFDGLPNVHLLFYRPWDSSCPSNPATFAFAVAVSIWLGDRKLGAVALAIATAWALARVFCGVHYPIDVLAGAALGSGMAYWLGRRSRAMAWVRSGLTAILKKGLVA